MSAGSGELPSGFPSGKDKLKDEGKNLLYMKCIEPRQGLGGFMVRLHVSSFRVIWGLSLGTCSPNWQP